MSQKDWDRLKVLHAAEKGLLAQKQAGLQLRLSERWVRKLLARLREEGRGRDCAWAAGAGVEASAARGAAAESGETGEARVCRFRAHSSGGVSGRATRGAGEQGDATPGS